MADDHNLSSCPCTSGGMVASTAAVLTRRRFVAGTSVLLGLNALGGAQAPHPVLAQAKPHRIDVHHHISPPSWLDAVKKAKLDNAPMSNWSVQKSLDDMDKAGIATVVVSPTTPQVNFLHGDKRAAARIARESNEYAGKLLADHPGRFGMFAMLPLPHIDESLQEIAYAFDALKADGIGTMTSYGDKWLGPPHNEKFTREIVDGELRRFYYDTAQIANSVTIGALAKLVPISQIVYGTDFPYRSGSEHVTGLARVFDAAELAAIDRENALRIIPRLRAA
jgi:predicted TIM-barrel fold metal-dependent hydrolase